MEMVGTKKAKSSLQERRGKEMKRGKSTLALALVLGVGERLERVSENRHANHFDCLFGKGVLSKE